MDFLSFIFGLLCLISIDTILGFIVYTLWKYFDMKYFSKLEINILKEENRYLKEQNKKVTGTDYEDWSMNHDNLY